MTETDWGNGVDSLGERSDAWNRLVSILPGDVLVVDVEGVIHHVGAPIARVSGYRVEELLGRSVEVLVPPDARRAHLERRADFLRDPKARPMSLDASFRLQTKDRGEMTVAITLAPITVDGELWVIAAMHPPTSASEDAHERQRELAATLSFVTMLAESEERFRLAFEANTAPMVLADINNRAIAVNESFCQLIGRSREEIIGADSSAYTHPDDQTISATVHQRVLSGDIGEATYTKRYLHRDGHVVVVEVAKSAARDAAGRILYFVISQRDVTEEQALIAQLSDQALHDHLTGLANRTLFEDRLAQARARGRRHATMGAVLLVDLDDFKGVNDTYGHLIGDQLLVGIARRFEMVTRDSDTLCRLGGDEFLYLADDIASPHEATEIALRLLAVLATPFEFDGIRIDQRASVGIALYDAQSPDGDCIQEADVALYEAKRERRGASVVFHPSMRQSAVSRFSLTQDLHVALASNDLTMHYQPIVDLATGTVEGFEALMRWHHASQGWISPEIFIPLAEQSALIVELGRKALREALSAAATWPAPSDGRASPSVSVNFSALEFHDRGIVQLIDDELAESGVAPERLVVEITERVALFDVTETLATTRRLQEMGVRVALDDFGTGHSSLSQLAQLHPAILKIDKSFVSPHHSSADLEALLEAVVALGAKLGIEVVAEGIETSSQLATLRTMGCGHGQGFYFSPAKRADLVPALAEHVFNL